jgi:hypothetical protein
LKVRALRNNWSRLASESNSLIGILCGKTRRQ